MDTTAKSHPSANGEPTGATILVARDVPQVDTDKLTALLSGQVPLAMTRGTFHGRAATFLCVALPGPESSEGVSLAMLPVAVMFDHDADGPHVTGPNGSRLMRPDGSPAPEPPTLHTGLYL